MLRLFFAIFFGKITRILVRVLNKSGGSAAPGLVSLAIDPNFVKKLSKNIPVNIVITGTNGKTTTSAMISQILTKSGKKIIHNNTGSNLSRGVASQLLSKSTLLGEIHTIDVGIWETDEAAFIDIVEQIHPEHIIILNISRDQLDRYGEINTILAKWKKTLQKMNWKSTLYLNADDANVFSLKQSVNSSFLTYGIENTPVEFEDKTANPMYDIKAKIVESSREGIEIIIAHNGYGKKLLLPVTGVYNVYNFLAAYLVTINLGVSLDEILNAIATFIPVFGRMEKVTLRNREGLIALIKNPMGASQVIHTIVPMMKKNSHVLIILNDNIADGTDVSWIWDTEFEKLPPMNHYFVLGTRRNDMALRLLYAGIDKKNITVVDSLDKIFKVALKEDLFILPTYTALLDLQEYLKVKGFKETSWHE